VELAKLARQQGQHFESATWLHRARRTPKEEFKRQVEKELIGRDSEPGELIYFRVYRSQVPVIERAIETAAQMLGSDKSRGYCLEMICADFLAGFAGGPQSRCPAAVDLALLPAASACATNGLSLGGQPESLMNMNKIGGKLQPLRLEPLSYRELHGQVLERDGWRCQHCGKMQGLEVHHIQPRGRSGEDKEENLITLCTLCHRHLHHHGPGGMGRSRPLL